MERGNRDEQPFRVFVSDNFHHMGEEDSSSAVASYSTYDEAVRAAQAIVEESVRAHGFDLNLYRQFGDDAYVVGAIPAGEARFSGWEYAEELCRARE